MQLVYQALVLYGILWIVTLPLVSWHIALKRYDASQD